MRWLDFVLLFAAGAFVLIGPLMALQEVGEAQVAAERDRRAREEAAFSGMPMDPPGPLDTSHREVWRFLLPVLALVAGVLGAFLLVRVHARRSVRAVARRPGLVLLAGLALLEAAYALDWAFFLDGGLLARALTVCILYPVAGILVAGAGYQLAVLEDTFAPLVARPALDDHPGEFGVAKKR